MKVLLIHNYVNPPSGENTVFDQETSLLRSNGVDVFTYTRHNQEIDNFGIKEKLRLPWGIIWSHRTASDLERIIDQYRPDVAHFHNIFPLISPAAYYVCQRRGVPVVQTIHNFRLICLNAYCFRDGAICFDCRKSLFQGIFRACYRNSKVQSAGVAVMLWLHGLWGTWTKMVTRYICLTPFQRDLFAQFGLPKQKLRIKPHFVQDPGSPSHNSKGDHALFIGRLGPEKGLETLIRAWENLPPLGLYVIGEGPLKEYLGRMVSTERVKFLGLVDNKTCMELLCASKFLVLPSECYETMSMVILEAMATGKPVLVSKLGSLPDLVIEGETGLLFKPGDSQDLTDKVQWLLEHEEEAEEIGRRAREEYEKKYTPEKNFDLLMKIYEEAISCTKNEKRF